MTTFWVPRSCSNPSSPGVFAFRRFKYYSALRLLAPPQHPLRVCLIGCLAGLRACLSEILERDFLYPGYLSVPAHVGTTTQTIRGLRGSLDCLPYHAARKHLGTTGGLERLRPRSAGSTLPRLWPTGSSVGWPPLITAWYFSSSPSDPTSRWAPCPPGLLTLRYFLLAVSAVSSFVPV